MSDIFPRLNINLNAAGVVAPAAIRSIEAIKQDVIAQFSKLSPGTSLAAEIIAKLDDGTFIANVANIPLRLALPNPAKVGERLNLTLLQMSPRLTFSMASGQAVALLDGSISSTAHDPALIPSSLTNGTAPRSPTTTKQDALAQLSKIPIGTTLTTEIIAKHEDGTVTAKIANVPLRLSINSPVEVGERLKLTLLQLLPRPIFSTKAGEVISIVNTASDETIATSSSSYKVTAQQTSVDKIGEQLISILTPSDKSGKQVLTEANTTKGPFLQLKPAANVVAQLYQEGSTIEPSVQIDLSPTAKILSSVLGEPTKSSRPLAIHGPEPLTDDTTARANPSRLADRIQTQLIRQIDTSGLFYEAHLSQWVQGEKTLEQIRMEPQAALTTAIENTVLTDIHEEQHTALTQLVHQQLDVLDQGRIVWIGQFTESVAMQMSIESVTEENQNGSEQADNPPTQNWRTHLKLNFPQLGEIELNILINGKSSDVHCKVESTEIMHTLHEHAKELIHAFEKSGNQLRSMKVSKK